MYTQTDTILLEGMTQTDHIYANKLAAELTLHQIWGESFTQGDKNHTKTLENWEWLTCSKTTITLRKT